MRVYLGDTITLTDTLDVDLTGAEVDAVIPGLLTDPEPATIDDPATGAVSFTTDASAAGVFQARWRVTSGLVVTTHLGPGIRVADPDAAWATIADVEALIGDQDDDAVLMAIDVATMLILSWLCEDVPDPLPWEFTAATALIASKLVLAPGPTDPVAETIGDYSYRLAGAPSTQALRNEIRDLLGPWLCGNIQSVRVWPDPALASVGDCLPEFQPDAEGFLRS